MKKADRQIIFDKYGGRCAYCGCELTGKWCADHIQAIYRKTKRVGGYQHKETGEYMNDDNFSGDFSDYKYVGYKSIPDGCHKPELDNIENLLPSCFSCNHYKSTMDLEMFRKNVGLLIMRLNRSFNQYKIAKRFGLVLETGIDVKFYFETLSANT